MAAGAVKTVAALCGAKLPLALVQVYKVFNRLNRHTNHEGTGIGLTICKSIVDKYNGKIWFESVENEGTTFFIQLPKVA
ncbi:MAG: hypothetical protein RLZZ292_2980 [Bacteroidota bacterium]